MKITHLSNSFIIIESNSLKICCDPWVGSANNGGWHSFPEYDKTELIEKVRDADYVYISHLHDDHFDAKFLIESGLIKSKFLIKKFSFKTLSKKLKLIGVSQIIELESFEIFNIKNIKLSILPQMATNSGELDEEVEYDIDTSLIISDGYNTFFNQVDNPYSLNDYIHLMDWVDLNFGKITIACLMCGAAGEYPQAFLNIDREVEKNSIIESSLNKLIETLKIIKPSILFLAGGTYFIPGKFYCLNKYIAQPNVQLVQNIISKFDLDVKLLNLEGGNAIEINKSGNELFLIKNEISSISLDMKNSIENHRFDLYDYEFYDRSISVEMVSQIFNMAKINWEKYINENSIIIPQDIIFVIYEDIKLNLSADKIIDNPICSFKLFNNTNHSSNLLKIHMDLMSFYLCLIREKVWNGTLGSLCLYERVPNVFYPSVTFSLNYLVLDGLQKENLKELI